MLDSVSGFTMPVEIKRGNEGLEVLDLGSMGGSDRPQGIYRRAASFNDLRRGRDRQTIGPLMRPTHSLRADFDMDGADEILMQE